MSSHPDSLGRVTKGRDDATKMEAYRSSKFPNNIHNLRPSVALNRAPMCMFRPPVANRRQQCHLPFPPIQSKLQGPPWNPRSCVFAERAKIPFDPNRQNDLQHIGTAIKCFATPVWGESNSSDGTLNENAYNKSARFYEGVFYCQNVICLQGTSVNI